MVSMFVLEGFGGCALALAHRVHTLDRGPPGAFQTTQLVRPGNSAASLELLSLESVIGRIRLVDIRGRIVTGEMTGVRIPRCMVARAIMTTAGKAIDIMPVTVIDVVIPASVGVIVQSTGYEIGLAVRTISTGTIRVHNTTAKERRDTNQR